MAFDCARTFKIGDDLTENELSKVGGLGLFCGSRICLKITQLNNFYYHFGQVTDEYS